MNDVIRCLLTRRSVKKYRAEQVEEEKLEQILQAGSYAACGMGKQAGKIVVLQDPADIAQLEKLNAQILGNPDLHPFYGAPTVCVVFADTSVGTWVEDGSLVIGNMLAAAHSLGVGSCWIHRARQEFELPEGKALMQKWGVGGPPPRGGPPPPRPPPPGPPPPPPPPPPVKEPRGGGRAVWLKGGGPAGSGGVGHCILGYAAAEPAPAKARKADFIVRV